MKKIKIAIDGHSSCGKSTIAKKLAKELDYIYVDTGAMYRAAALYFDRKNISADSKVLIDELNDLNLEFRILEDHELPTIYLNGENVENEIRTIEISNLVSSYSKVPELRQKLVSEQQKIGSHGGVVMDGRDIGSVVFPDAELKIFMTARPEIRAQRRYDELIEKGSHVTYEAVLDNVISRDKEDSSRKESPLIQVEDAILLDNSDISREEQFNFVNELVQKKLK